MEKLADQQAERLCKKYGMVFRPKGRGNALYWKDYELKSLEDLYDTTLRAFKEFEPFIPLVDQAFAREKTK